MAGVTTFAKQLAELGYQPALLAENIVAFDYEVEVGPLAGDTVKIALQVPTDFPLTPPGGPMVSPRVMPLNGASAPHPHGAVHAAESGGMQDPGGMWEYWSRPFPNPPGWHTTSRDARAYLCHLRTLFNTLPDDLQHRPHN